LSDDVEDVADVELVGLVDPVDETGVVAATLMSVSFQAA
jgi:hypothetical protein